MPIVDGLLTGPLTQSGKPKPPDDTGFDSVTVTLRVVRGLYPHDSTPFSSSARDRWRSKLARAKDPTGLPSHQSKARKPPALPEAAHATADCSTRVTETPFLARKYAVQTPITPPPHTTIRFEVSPPSARFFAIGFDELERIVIVRVWVNRLDNAGGNDEDEINAI